MSQRNDADLTELEKIQANAELVIRIMREDGDVELKYDQASVKWIDEFIERHRKNFDQHATNHLVSILGSFVGECLRREYGGEWKEVNGQWGILFNPPNVAFPFAKIAKQFANGHEGGDSIYSFYKMTPHIMKLKPSANTSPDNQGTTD